MLLCVIVWLLFVGRGEGVLVARYGDSIVARRRGRSDRMFWWNERQPGGVGFVVECFEGYTAV